MKKNETRKIDSKVATANVNAEMLQMLGILSNDDSYMRKALAYVKKLVARKEEFPVMTRDEIVADIREAAEELNASQRGEKHLTSWEDFKKELKDEGYYD